MADVTVQNCGTLFLFGFETEQAREWEEENIGAEAMHHSDGRLVVEHRYASDIAQGITDSGLSLGDA